MDQSKTLFLFALSQHDYKLNLSIGRINGGSMGLKSVQEKLHCHHLCANSLRVLGFIIDDEWGKREGPTKGVDGSDRNDDDGGWEGDFTEL